MPHPIIVSGSKLCWPFLGLFLLKSVGKTSNYALILFSCFQIMLMSGLGQSDQAELSSERNYDRIPHFCNMLRFAVLRKNNSLMAIGGPWDTVDGGDPSVDDASLIQTALRFITWGFSSILVSISCSDLRKILFQVCERCN